MLESAFKKYAIQAIQDKFVELDLDFIHTKPYNRSMPDLVILAAPFWAALEFKTSKQAPSRPNQDYHINRLNKKGYASFVFPENLEEVLYELEGVFSS
jgi:hypothetical protein